LEQPFQLIGFRRYDRLNVYDEIKQGEKGAWIGLVAFLILSSGKLISGYFLHSAALLADGFNNLTDIIATTAIIIGMRISRKPADANHTYGHFRAETVAVLIASFIMALVGIQVLIDSIKSLLSGKHEAPNPSSAIVAGVSAALLLVIYWYNRRLAKRVNSQALMATAKDSFSDAMVSIGAGVGIIGAELGVDWMDPAAAIAVGLLILKTAWDIFWDATNRLTDGIDAEELKDLRSVIARISGVEGIRDMKARLYGSRTLVDVIITVNPRLDVTQGHEISERVQEQVAKVKNIMYVNVHVEPNNLV
jgi:cation diffusion facilitator family transporter